MYQVNLKFGNGNISDGFPCVTADFQIEGKINASITGFLPANEQLNDTYDQWHSKYKNFCDYCNYSPRIIVQEDNTNDIFSLDNFDKSTKDLKYQFNQWFASNSFNKIKEYLIKFINQHEHNDVVIVVCTDNLTLCKLPWNSWLLIEHYSKVRLSFSSLDYEKTNNHDLTKSKKKKEVKILIVLGNSFNIPLSKDDRSLFETLPNSSCTILDEPTRKELSSKLCLESWDILFFAGHSQTNQEEGKFLLNDEGKLTIEKFKYALKDSISLGLQLAIFNSCDGLGLASELGKLSLPFSVIMREPIPDIIAHDFLKFFLNSFSQGENLHSAITIAQQRLQGYESKFPFVSNLPLIYQNIDAQSLTWESLENNQYKPSSNAFSEKNIINKNKKVFSLSKSVIGVVLTIVAIGGGLSYKKLNNKSFILKHAVDLEMSTSLLNLANAQESNLFSEGDKILFKFDSNPRLKEGVKYFSNKQYLDAANQFRIARQTNSSNPELLIYYNNSLSLHRDLYYTLAVVVPVNINQGNAKEMLRGVAMAQDQYNKKAKDDQPLLRIIIANDNNDPLKAQKIAAILSQNPEIIGVIGHNSSDATEAALVEYEKKNLPVISPTSSGSFLNSPIFFRTTISNQYQAKQLVNYTRSLKSEKVVIFHDSNSRYSQDLKKIYQESFPEKIIKEYDLSDLNLDFSFELAKIAYNNEADTVVILSSATSDLVAIELIQANDKLPPEYQLNLLGSDSLYNSDVLNILKQGENAVNNLTITGLSWNSITPETKNFLEFGKEIWKEKLNWRVASSYDAAQAFIKVLKPNISRHQVLELLRDVQLKPDETSGRSIEFDNDGNINSNPAMLKINNIDGESKFTIK